MSVVLVMIGAALPIASGAFVVHRNRRHPVDWLLMFHGISFAAVLAAAGSHADGVGLIVDQFLSGA